MTAVLLLQLINSCLAQAPKAIEVVNAAKDFIRALFEGGLLTIAEQDALMAYVNGVAALSQAGIVPPAWQVRPDPV